MSGHTYKKLGSICSAVTYLQTKTLDRIIKKLCLKCFRCWIVLRLVLWDPRIPEENLWYPCLYSPVLVFNLKLLLIRGRGPSQHSKRGQNKRILFDNLPNLETKKKKIWFELLAVFLLIKLLHRHALTLGTYTESDWSLDFVNPQFLWSLISETQNLAGFWFAVRFPQTINKISRSMLYLDIHDLKVPGSDLIICNYHIFEKP